MQKSSLTTRDDYEYWKTLCSTGLQSLGVGRLWRSTTLHCGTEFRSTGLQSLGVAGKRWGLWAYGEKTEKSDNTPAQRDSKVSESPENDGKNGKNGKSGKNGSVIEKSDKASAQQLFNISEM